MFKKISHNIPSECLNLEKYYFKSIHKPKQACKFFIIHLWQDEYGNWEQVLRNFYRSLTKKLHVCSI